MPAPGRVSGAAGALRSLRALAAAAALAAAGAAGGAEFANPHGVAVIIGNGDYAHGDVPDVAYAHRDAAAFQRYVVDVLGFDPENVIHERDATLTVMNRVFGNERGHAQSDLSIFLYGGERAYDVVVFYSGHGVPGLGDGKGYLLPVDAAPNTASVNGYAIDTLYDILGKLENARSVRVFLDACFSGDSAGGPLLGELSGPPTLEARRPDPAARVTALAAATGSQVASWDSEARHGLFTHHLLDALYGAGDADGDGRVTAAEAKTYLDRYMTRAALRLHRRTQQADLGGDAAAVLSAPEGGFPERPEIELASGGSAADPAEAERALGLSPEDWTSVQRGLGALGFDPGPADGDPGQKTRYAISSWQNAKGYGTTSYLTEDQAETLTASAQPLGRAFSAEWRDEATGWTDLHYAAALNLPDAVTDLVEAGMDPDVRLTTNRAPFGDLSDNLAALGLGDSFAGWYSDGETPAMIAAVTNSAAALAELVALGADTDAGNTYLEGRPLHYAAARGALEVARFLVARGADVEARTDDGRTPLHQAALNDALDVAKFLVARGADVNATTNDGRTPLYEAAQANALEVARFLVARGADVEARTDDGRTPLYEAAQANALEVARFLVARGADVNAMDNNSNTPLHLAAWWNSPDEVDAAKFLIERGADVNARNDQGNTPLNWAAFQNHSNTAKFLIERGADINTRSDSGLTLLHSAAWGNALDLAKFLVARDADVEARDDRGWTPLHEATQGGALDVARFLIERGANVDAMDNDGQTPINVRDHEGKTPMHVAAEKNSLEMASFLVARGADIDAMDNYGQTPLHEAAEKNSLEMASFLVARGADIDAMANYGQTPLHRAAWSDALDVAKLLVARGADVDATATDTDGRTPLHQAALNDALDVAKFLVARGADVNATTNDGRTPLSVASGTMAEWLEEQGAVEP